LLSRDRFADLLAWAETAYDQILIDSPPVLAAADAMIAGRLVDGILLVVQPDKNHRRSVLRAVDGVNSLECNLLGTVINAVSEDDGTSYYGYGGYGYGYGYGSEAYGDAVDGQPDTVPLPSDLPPEIEEEPGDSWFNWKQSA
jgi:Mrp family chromosome partitioning ATPase